jgi:serine/threonine protein kinase
VAEPNSLDDEQCTWAGSTGSNHAGSRGLRPELLVSGRYRIGALLGAGGMGLVYEAEHLGLGLGVAVKVLRPELLDREERVARFRQEARCTARLRGDHVVRVLDEGRLETGLPFFVMERLHGLDLRTLLLACSTLPTPVVVDYARQICSALGEAHAAGIIHRDIKPANLFITSQASGHSRVKLLDFGIAQHEAFDDAGEQLGTSAYASPEQLLRPDQVDARSDIWSLGVVLFEALTGCLPLVDGWFRQRRLDLRPLEARSDLPEALRAIVRCCLAEDATARFGSAAELARALEPFGVAHRDDSAAPRSEPRRPEARYRRNVLMPRASLWGDAQVLRSFPPPRRAPVRPRPALHGSQHRA